jgi:hypothetical protein
MGHSEQNLDGNSGHVIAGDGDDFSEAGLSKKGSGAR